MSPYAYGVHVRENRRYQTRGTHVVKGTPDRGMRMYACLHILCVRICMYVYTYGVCMCVYVCVRAETGGDKPWVQMIAGEDAWEGRVSVSATGVYVYVCM